MADCKKCVFYSEENDELRRSHNDVLILGESNEDVHFCFAFDQIPEKTFETEKACPSFVKDNIK